MTDWLDQLSALRSSLPEGEAVADETPEEQEPYTAPGHSLLITYEKKGRGGKQATIVSGFTCSDEQLLEIASTLKKRLATGGSARGGEILVQGDRRQDVLNTLKAMGLKAKIG